MCSLHHFILSLVILTCIFHVIAPRAIMRQGLLLLPLALFGWDCNNSPKSGQWVPSPTVITVLMVSPLTNTCSLLHMPFMPCEGQVPMVPPAISYFPKSFNVSHTNCSVGHLKLHDSKCQGLLRLLGNPLLFWLDTPHPLDCRLPNSLLPPPPSPSYLFFLKWFLFHWLIDWLIF